MTDLDRNYEMQVLRDVAAQLEDPESTGRKQTALRRMILGVGSAVLFVASVLGINDLAHSVIIMFIAGMGGAAIGFGLYLKFAQKQWPITSKYIDIEAVKNRISELET